MPGFFTTQPDKWASVQGACRLGSRGWPTLRFAGLAASWKTGFAPHVHLDFSRAALETLLAVWYWHLQRHWKHGALQMPTTGYGVEGDGMQAVRLAGEQKAVVVATGDLPCKAGALPRRRWSPHSRR